MRKKTIEEELKEIAEEKEEHIESLHEEYLSSSHNHTYDFDNCNQKEESEAKQQDEEEFTAQDRQELDKFHKGIRDIHDDAEWDEYMRLCEKYNKAIKNGTLYKSADINAANSLIRKNGSASAKGAIANILFLFIFVAAGLCVMIFPGILPLMRLTNIEYVEVESKVTSITVKTENSKSIAILAVDFNYDSKKYHTYVKLDVTHIPVPQIGETLTIKINPKDPTNIKQTNYTSEIVCIVFGAIFAGFAIFCQMMLISQARKSKTSKA